MSITKELCNYESCFRTAKRIHHMEGEPFKLCETHKQELSEEYADVPDGRIMSKVGQALADRKEWFQYNATDELNQNEKKQIEIIW